MLASERQFLHVESEGQGRARVATGRTPMWTSYCPGAGATQGQELARILAFMVLKMECLAR